MNSEEAIKNLETLAVALEKAANCPKNYNTEFAQYLENMSWEMQKNANQLREISHLFGLTNSININIA
jgi:hypothetical protein